MDRIYSTFVDKKRQHEIYKFYQACQLHRNYYRGYPNSNHPLDFFTKPSAVDPPDPTSVYLKFPFYHVRYKMPVALQTRPPGDPAARRFDARYSIEGDTSYHR